MSNDTELLREAVRLLANMESVGYDSAKRQIVISREVWLTLTENFRERMQAEQSRRLEGRVR